jgi:hypothetical protein
MLAGGVLLLTCVAVQAATATIERPIPAPHHLWTSHGLAAMLVALAVFLAARSLPIAGIMIVSAGWYAVAVLGGAPVSPEALALFGPRYAFHVQATAMLIPAAALAGFGLQRTARRSNLAQMGLGWMLGPARG